MALDMIILGVTGTNGGGKDTVGDYLKTKGFVPYSLSDYLRKVLGTSERTSEEVRNDLRKLGNQLREQHGPGFLAEKALESFEPGKRYVVTSIRSPGEITILKKAKNFRLIGVDAPVEDRYQRILLRGDTISFKQFKKDDEKERFGDKNSQQLDACMELADFKVYNPGVGKESVERLKREIDMILERMR